MLKASVRQSPQYFFVKRPDEERDYELEAICGNMELTRNGKINERVLSFDDKFCENPSMTTDLIDNMATPRIYTLYLFEDDEDEDEDANAQYQISKLLSVLTFSKSVIGGIVTGDIEIVTLCVKQDTRKTHNGNVINRGYGSKIVNCLFNAVQLYVNQTNKQINIRLTPTETSIGFYKKMGMRIGAKGILGDTVMFKTFIPTLTLTLKYTNGIDPQFVDDFNDLSERGNVNDLANFVISQTTPTIIIKAIYKQNRHLKMLINFIAHLPPKYHILIEALKNPKTPKMSRTTIAKGVSNKRSTRKKGSKKKKKNVVGIK